MCTWLHGFIILSSLTNLSLTKWRNYFKRLKITWIIKTWIFTEALANSWVILKNEYHNFISSSNDRLPLFVYVVLSEMYSAALTAIKPNIKTNCTSSLENLLIPAPPLIRALEPDFKLLYHKVTKVLKNDGAYSTTLFSLSKILVIAKDFVYH